MIVHVKIFTRNDDHGKTTFISMRRFILYRFINVQQLINSWSNDEQKQTNLDFNIKTKIIYNYDTIFYMSFSMNNAHFVKLSGREIFIHFSHIHNFAHPKHTKFLAQTEWET